MVRKQMEGDNRQRRAAAREAREEGVSPSEAGVTTGASKQNRHMKAKASHEEKIEAIRQGKQPSVQQGAPGTRPASGIPEQEPR